MRRISVLVALGAVVLAAGCATKKADPLETVHDGQVRLFGTDGNMSDSFGDTLKGEPGVLAGMKGTKPLNPLSEDFKRRLRAVDSALTDYTYSAESYDATVVEALAAEAARSADGPTIAKYVTGITVGGTRCESVKACLDLIRAGKDPEYRGVSLRRSGFTDAGEPSTTMYGTLNFGRDNHIDDAKTEYVGAGDESTETKAAQPPVAPPSKPGKVTGGPLRIGGLVPHTGALGYVGPSITAGLKLAINEINEAGGVLGEPVQFVDGDDGTSGDVANSTLDALIAKGVTAVVGPCCSGVSLKVLPKIVEHGIVTISMSATSDALTNIDDHGLFFRTAPPDKLQAKALADIVMRDGSDKVMIIARDDAYGNGLKQAVQADLAAAGVRAGNVRGMSYKVKDKYDPNDLNTLFRPIGHNVKQFAPNAVVIVGFEESGMVVKALKAEGIVFRAS